MKNYFNNEERMRHIILLAMQSNINDMLLSSNAITKEERKFLKTAQTQVTKFNASVFERFGLPYRRKIEMTMQSNDLRLVGKHSAIAEAINYSAAEDLQGVIEEIKLNCIDCKRKDYTNCAIYAISVACDCTSNNKCGGCPFAVTTNDFEEPISELRM